MYFQPPNDAQIEYPCIVYERDNPNHIKSADNSVYDWQQRYQVIYMDYKPDSDVFTKLVNFPYSRFQRHYATSGLNHDVFVIYH